MVDQGAVDGFMATAVEMVVGAILVAASAGWGQLRAWLAHGRFAAAWAALNAADEAASLPEAAAGQADSSGTTA